MAGESWQEAWVEVLPDLREFRAKANREMSGVLGSAGTAGGALAGGNISGGILGSIKGLAVPVLGAIAALGIGQAVGQAIGSGIRYAVDSVPLASDLAETRSAIAQVFGDAGDDIVAFADGANRRLGQTRVQALQAAQTFGVFAKAANLTGDPLANFSTGLVTLSTDLASFYNTSPQEAIDAIGAGLRGEAEPLRRYGILLDDSVLKQRAMTLGIYDGNGALSSQQRIIAAQAEIYAQATIAQGDFGRTSEGLAGQQKILEASLQDVQTSLGEYLLPGFTSIVSYANAELIPRLGDVIDRVGPRLAGALERSAPTFERLLDATGPLVDDLTDLAVDSLPGLVEGLSDVVENGPEVLQFFRDFAKGLEPFLPGGTFSPPSGIQNLSDFFDSFEAGVQDIQEQELGQQLFEGIGSAGGAQAAGAGMASNFGLGIEDEFPNVRDSWESQLGGLTDASTRDRSRGGAFGLGENFTEGLAEGILVKKGRATAAAKEVADAVTAVVGKGWDIASPSKVARRQGGFFGEGLALGLEDSLPAVTSMGDMLAAAALVEADRGSLAMAASSAGQASMARESQILQMSQMVAPAAAAAPTTLTIVDVNGDLIGRMRVEAQTEARGVVRGYDEDRSQRERGGVRKQ